MDGDMHMSDGHQSSYPAPDSATSTPYPALNRQDGERRALVSQGGSASATPAPVSTISETSRGYLTLAQYFDIGRSQPQALMAASRAADDADAAEDARPGNGDDEALDEAPEGEISEQTQGVGPMLQAPTKSAESSARQQLLQIRPQQEDVWTSLPGVHALPDDDYLEGQTPQNGWPNQACAPALAVAPQATEADRGATRGRGRGRGRPRGRRGWKWALKGTAHADMFQSPKITAEASGTKRRGRGSRAKGTGARGRPRKDNAARAALIDPGEDFKELQARATTAFLDGNFDAALEFSLQAVSKNPEVPAAHLLIDQVFTAQGRHEEALQSHWMATLTSSDAQAWMSHGERLLNLAGDNKTDKDFDAAFRCFSEALRRDKNNTTIRSRKIDLFLEMKAYKHAFRECRGYMKLLPADTDMLWKFAEISKLAGENKDFKIPQEERNLRVVEAYRAAFHEWRGETVFGDAEMQWAHLDMYLGLLEESGTPPQDCIRELKQYARWFLGRTHEIFWEQLDDDREFDLTPERRIATSFFQRRMFNLEESRYGQGLPVWLRAKLASLRAKLGFQYREEALRHLDVLLLQPGAAEDSPETFMFTAERLSALSWYQDAIKLYEAAKDQEHADPSRYFLGMGNCYRRLGRLTDAETAFRAAVPFEDEKLDARIHLARLCAELGRKDEAAKIALEISQLGRQNIQRKEKTILTKKRTVPAPPPPPKLKTLVPAAPIEDQDSRLQLVLQHLPDAPEGGPEGTESFPEGAGKNGEGNDAEDGSSDEETESMSTAHETTKPRKGGRKGRMAHREEMQLLREQYARVQTSYQVIKKLWPVVEGEDGDEGAVREWMGHAEILFKEFTSMKAFYPQQRSDRFIGLLAGKNYEARKVIEEMDALRKQLQDFSVEGRDDSETMPTADDRTSGDFHDISFHEWHRILADLALQYVRFADQEKCNDTVDHLTRANVFRHDFALYNTTLALSIYCAIIFNDRVLFMEASRQYLYQSDYRSGMAYQIYAAADSVGYGDSAFDSDGAKMQQWTHRLVKAQDMLIMTDEMRDRWEWGVTEFGGSKPRHKRIGKADEGLLPGLLTTYAHITTSKRRVHSAGALSYLFRALALKPDDVVVNLSIATNCIIDGLRRARPENAGLDRNGTIQQGLGFFYRYYNARVAAGRKCYVQEAEYNAARTWDLLGWTHLAAKGYEKVLKLSPEVREEAEQAGEEVQDMASEAAFALQKIFVAAENEDAARAIGEQWLVV